MLLTCAFHVVDTKGPIILGFPTCSDMKLITLNNGITVSPARAAAPPAPTAADHPADKSSLLREYSKCFLKVLDVLRGNSTLP